MIGVSGIYKNILTNTMKEIRKSMNSLSPNTDATYLYFEKTLLPPIGSNGYQKNFMMPFLILVTNPCSHILRSGGCTMCGYSNLASFKQNIDGESVYNQFKKGFDIIKKIPHHEMVAIGTAGSFLDPKEIPLDIQAKIIKELNSSDNIYYINIEARAEYVTEESLENIVKVIDDPYKLSIGVGLESSNDLIRELCVNKCLSAELFAKAIKLLKKYSISPTAYVTLGKPFINDCANIIDAVESIKFAFQYGADRIVLLRLGVQPNCFVEWLYKRGLYNLIGIWAMIEVLRRLPIGLLKDVLIADPRLPKHLDVKECSCAQTAMELLGEYKGSLDYRYIKAIDMLSCSHKKEWYEKLEEERELAVDVESQISDSYTQWMEVWQNEH